ncbi:MULTISPECIES: hypothetical protein [Streptomyces]|uniref:hypothetical protein n=1 Tax=Streptomyces TaxID=1883 RepID=UPI001E292B23|nr:MULTISPECIES: hypothetical protein [Streptomyces]
MDGLMASLTDGLIAVLRDRFGIGLRDGLTGVLMGGLRVLSRWRRVSWLPSCAVIRPSNPAVLSNVLSGSVMERS